MDVASGSVANINITIVASPTFVPGNTGAAVITSAYDNNKVRIIYVFYGYIALPVAIATAWAARDVVLHIGATTALNRSPPRPGQQASLGPKVPATNLAPDWGNQVARGCRSRKKIDNAT